MGTREVEEVRRVNRLIRQFEAVFKTTEDDYQKDRARKELKELKAYREQYLALHEVDQSELEETAEPDAALKPYSILRDLLRSEVPARERHDEIDHLTLYMDFFYEEFMIFLTPKKLRLDSKFSLERDKFYTEFHELLRQVRDFQKTVESSRKIVEKAEFRADIVTEAKSRTNKLRTNLLIKAARYFARVRDFAADLAEDVEAQNGACKNGNEVLDFRETRGVRYLSGLTVWHGLLLLLALSREIVAYLNVPDAALQ